MIDILKSWLDIDNTLYDLWNFYLSWGIKLLLILCFWGKWSRFRYGPDRASFCISYLGMRGRARRNLLCWGAWGTFSHRDVWWRGLAEETEKCWVFHRKASDLWNIIYCLLGKYSNVNMIFISGSWPTHSTYWATAVPQDWKKPKYDILGIVDTKISPECCSVNNLKITRDYIYCYVILLTGFLAIVLRAFVFPSECPLIPGNVGSATRWSSSRPPWLEAIALKNASASAPVRDSQELFSMSQRQNDTCLTLCVLCLSDLWVHYLKHFHCVWESQMYFCWVVKSNVALPYGHFVHDLSFVGTAPALLQRSPKSV